MGFSRLGLSFFYANARTGRVCVPRGVVLRGEMIVALTLRLLFHGCLVKKLVDLITDSRGREGTRPRVGM